MHKIRMREIAVAILEFEEQFNAKVTPLFEPERDEERRLTRSQVKALFLLYGGMARTGTELGSALGMTRASLTGILDALETAGLAARERDGADRRRAIVSLTSTGREFCARKARQMDAKLERRFEALSEAERSEFIRCLEGAATLLRRLED